MSDATEQRMAALEASHRELIKALDSILIWARGGPGIGYAIEVIAYARRLQEPEQSHD